MSDATWLEGDDEYEGVGAHHSNPRYAPVDEDGFDSVTGQPLSAREVTDPHSEFPDVDQVTGDERETTDENGEPV